MPTPRSGYVYLLGSSKFGWFKIGKAIDAQLRVRHLGILLPFKIELFALWKTSDPLRLERLMHLKYSSASINGEWFSFNQFELYDVLRDSQPIDSQLVEKSEIFTSNIRRDVVNTVTNYQRRQKGLAFCEAVKEFLRDKNLERTKENLKTARAAVLGEHCAIISSIKPRPKKASLGA